MLLVALAESPPLGFTVVWWCRYDPMKAAAIWWPPGWGLRREDPDRISSLAFLSLSLKLNGAIVGEQGTKQHPA